MTILVTGSTGFIGSQLCRALVAAGHPVRAFHRPESSLTALEGLPVEHAVGDVTQPHTLEEALRGVEIVFHTAAVVGRSIRREQAYAVTVEGTRSLLRLAGEAGVRRVVHTSSAAALGVPRPVPGGQPMLMDETHSWNYRPEWWPYGHSKYLAEVAVQEAVAQGLDVVIVNPTVVIGAGDLNRISGNYIIQVARKRIPVAPPGGLNVIHIDDVVRGHLAALERGRTGERYLLGNENLTHQRFLRMIAEVVDARPPGPVVPAALLRSLAGPAKQAGRWLPLPISADNLRRAGYFFYFDMLKARSHLGLGQLRSTYDAITDAYAYFCEKGWI